MKTILIAIVTLVFLAGILHIARYVEPTWLVQLTIIMGAGVLALLLNEL